MMSKTTEAVDPLQEFLNSIAQNNDAAVAVDKAQAQKALDHYRKMQKQQKQNRAQREGTRKVDKINIDRLVIENSDLKSRINAVPGSHTTDDNLSIASMSAGTTPTQLIANFKDVFTNEWKQAYTELEHLGFPDERIIFTLVDIFKGAEFFCQNASTQQLQFMADRNQLVLQEIRQPGLECIGIRDLQMPPMPKDTNRAVEGITANHLKSYRKELADLSMTGIIEMYIEGRLKPLLASQVHKSYSDIPSRPPQRQHVSVSKGISAYVHKLVGLIWSMSVQEPPPIFLWSDPNTRVRTDRYNFYRADGDHVLWTVWPAVMLHEDGPLMEKGIVNAA